MYSGNVWAPDALMLENQVTNQPCKCTTDLSARHQEVALEYALMVIRHMLSVLPLICNP
jgi:hypothetical protein